MTGREMYAGWVKAADKLGLSAMEWDALCSLSPKFETTWNGVAEAIALHGQPSDWYSFWRSFGEPGQPSAIVQAICSELVSGWSGYFNFTGAVESDHKDGDVWVFNASKLKAKVKTVSGTQVILTINGVPTGWIEVEELEKNAKRETK